MIKLIGRFIRSFRFYCQCVGFKNALTVELPGFIDMAKEYGLPEYSLMFNIVDIMEDCEEDYRQSM